MDEGFCDEFVYCLVCTQSDKGCGYYKYRECHHYMCADCVFNPEVEVPGHLSAACKECFLLDTRNATQPEVECPICYLHYQASGCSPQEHWETEHALSDSVDEGIREMLVKC